jgi:Xaa-Pro aminopeptidase
MNSPFCEFIKERKPVNFNTSVNTPESEIDERIAKLQQRLAESGIDGALILQNTDLFYFAGTIQQGHLYIPAQGQPVLMIKKSLHRAMAESGIRRIVPLQSLIRLPALLRENGIPIPQTLGMELDVLPVNYYLKYKELFDQSRIVDISHHIRMVRAVKSPFEIDRIRKAAKLADQVAGCLKEELKEGITEVQLAGRMEAIARALGHQGMIRMRLWGSEMFYGHLMCGASAAVPSSLASPTGGEALSPAFSQGPGFKKIQCHQPVLFDYVFAYKGYLADHTRIFSIGDLPGELLRAHQAMLDLQNILAKQALPGVITGDIYETAMAWVHESGYDDFFMGAEKERIQFIGHGIGLELDEYPFLARGQTLKLQEGMVIALEPKLVIPNKGVLGIENTHVVTETGLKRLTNYPDSITIVNAS